MNQALVTPQAPASRQKRETLKIGSRPPVRSAPSSAAPASPATIIVPSAPQLFALGRLMRAPENVRHTRIEDGCEELADDIVAHGLLQSLIGYEDGNNVEIVGGGRRLKALRLVRDRGHINDDWPVPVLIRGIDEAVELSLAENLQQRTMSPVDEVFAFAELMKRPDNSPAALAKRFGFSERVVKQRLRLAQLAKPVLDALADRQITLDAAMAYATSQDTALQIEVFEHQGKRGRTAHDPSTVRHSLRMKGIDTADRLYLYVGAGHYEREGGAYEDDLFNEVGKDRVLRHPFMLDSMANRKVDGDAGGLIEQLRHDGRWAPTIAGYVKVPDLRLHSYGTNEKMRPPAGFVQVEKADSDKLWRTIRNNGLNAHVVVGLDVAGKLIADPRFAFVPLGQKGAIEKPALADVAADRERNAAADRERQIIRWSRRLAVPAFAGTPFENRAFWPEPHLDHQTPHTHGGVPGFLVSALMFVTNDEIAAHRREATKRVDQQIAARDQGGAS